MQKIADMAGVSRATVSRVLSDPDKVKLKTRELIQSIIDEFGYTYHAGAAELIKRKTFLIGLVMPSGVSPIFDSTVMAVQRAATELGMSIILGCSEFDAKKEAAILGQFLIRRVAGVILIGCAKENEPYIEKLQRSGIPCVIIWTTPRNSNLCQAGFDNEIAAASAVNHLVNMGHCRIALITGPLAGGRRVEDRINGYRRTMQESGLPVPADYQRSVEPTIADGERETMNLLGLPEPPTAIFAASDMLAIGAMSAARKMSLKVPSDLSIIGFDDIEFAAHTVPPLTTVAVPAVEMSRTAIRLLKQLINKEVTPPKSYWLDTELIVRKSCAPPAR